MKTTTWTLALLAAAAFGLVGCGDKEASTTPGDSGASSGAAAAKIAFKCSKGGCSKTGNALAANPPS